MFDLNTLSAPYFLPHKETMVNMIGFDKADTESNKYKIIQKLHSFILLILLK